MLKRNSNPDSLTPSELTLSNKQLTDFHIFQLSKLHNPIHITSLTLSHNVISGELSFWSTLSHFSSLLALNLSHNTVKLCYLTYLPSCLQTLDLSSNRISEITLHQQLSSLRSLSLNDNVLLRLQVNHQNCSLQEINVSNNKLSVLGLGQLTRLQEVNASGNEIVVVNLSNSVRKVNLARNLLKTLIFVGKLARLEYLNLSGNEVKELEFKRGEVKPDLKYLDVSKNKIKVIDGLEALPNLEVLNLSNNQLKLSFAKQVLKLKHLKQFECLGNEFDQALTEIETAKNLLKNQLPIRTLQIFNRSTNRTSRSSTFDKLNYLPNSNFQKHDSIQYQKFSNRKRRSFQFSMHDTNIKQSPFKLFLGEGRGQPIEYTLGDLSSNVSRRLEMGKVSKRSVERKVKAGNEKNDHEVKYFLQILSKYSMIPLKPILKVETHLTHQGQILDGIEYNLLKDLYHSQGMRFTKITKVTNITELKEIQKVLRINERNPSNQSLMFLHNDLNKDHVERYLNSKITFNEVVGECKQQHDLGKYPNKGLKNYVVKSTPVVQKGKENSKKLLFTLIYLIQ